MTDLAIGSAPVVSDGAAERLARLAARRADAAGAPIARPNAPTEPLPNVTVVSDAAAERLARLAGRRAPAAAAAPAADVIPGSAPSTPSVGVARRRRPSPAMSAKIVTVGASTTAMLGMMAAFGIADRPEASLQAVEAVGAATLPAPVVTAAPTVTSAPVATAAPVIAPAPADTAVPTVGPTVTTPPATPAVTPEAVPVATAQPQPVAVPVAVDVAVPAPPPPPPAPTQQASPQQAAPQQAAPQPQAQSSGS